MDTLTSQLDLPSWPAHNPAPLTDWVRRCLRVRTLASALAVIGALTVLLGWLLNSNLLIRGSSDGLATHPLSALCYLAIALALLGKPHPIKRTLLWSVFIISVVQLLLYLFSSPVMLDDLLFPALPDKGLPFSSHMYPVVALLILTLSLAALVIGHPRQTMVEAGQWLSLFPAAIGLISFAGHMFDVEDQFTLFTSVHGSITACLLTISLFCSRPDLGLMRILGEPGFASLALRWMLPIGLSVPFMLGATQLWLRSHHMIDRQTGIFIEVLVTSLLFAIAALTTAKAGYALELKRRKAENDLRELNDDLEHRIDLRTAELKESESRFRDLVEVAPYGIVVADLDGRIRMTNPQACQQFGYTAAEMNGLSVDMLLPADMRTQHAKYREHFAQAPSSRQMGKGRDLLALRRDGSTFPVEIALAPLATPAGQAVVATVIDITQRKQIESEIRSLNAELEQRVQTRTAELNDSIKELEAFTYSVSHDLRAPLRHIQGYLELLSEDTSNHLSDEGKRYLDIVIASSREMNTLIDDLLAFSRISRAEMQMQSVDMEALVQTTVDSLRQDIRNRPIEWNIRPLPEVCGDPALLKLAMLNLVGNAIKYTRQRDPARIEIGYQATPEGEEAYYIKDNGAGFDMKYIDKLFGVFQRLHRHSEFEGTGIGLANVRRIITKHGGKVWAEGAVDQGAIFYFTLPQSEGESTCTQENNT